MFQTLFLLLNEFMHLIKFFLNLSIASCRDLFKFFSDFELIFLEHLNLLKDIEAFTSTVDNELLITLIPTEFPHTWLNLPIQVIQMLLEEGFLFITDRMYDRIVVSDYEHDILSQDSQLLLLANEFSHIMRYVHIPQSLNLVPIGNFYEYFQQVTIKVAL